MTFRLTTHTATIDAAPGEMTTGRIEIHNDGTAIAVYDVTVVGIDSAGVDEVAVVPPLRISIDSGQSAIVDVAVPVPRTLGIGQHAAAFEVSSSARDDRAALAPFTLSIASVARVELVPTPSTIRARRRAAFHLDITNREPLPVDVAISGEAPDVAVSFSPAAFTLQPGQRAIAKAKVKGPRHWSGESTQHNLVITARGRAASTTTTAAYVQRPVFARRMRMVVAAFTVVALWAGAVLGAYVWLNDRNDANNADNAALVGIDTDGDGEVDSFKDADGNPVTGVDTDGDGIADTFLDADGNPIPGTDANGDGIPDTIVNADGKRLTAIDTDGDGIPDALSDGSPLPDDDVTAAAEPKGTIVKGTVAIDGDPTTVAVTLTPVALGAPADAAAPIACRGAEPSEPTGKVWSVRSELTGGEMRRTLAIAPASPATVSDQGVWLFSDVLQGQSYELSFASPGFDRQSFIVTPTDDGEPISFDVEMSPGKGALSGAVMGPNGPLGGAEIQVTDGTLSFTTTSDSTTGTWSLEGLATPGVYTMSASLRGYATAVRQVDLSAGDEQSGITLQMVPGLATISGRVVGSDNQPLGGVTITASNGETTLRTTSLTEGDVGSFSLPQLAVGPTYTLKAEFDGYVTQTQRVPLTGSTGGVHFDMARETFTLTGRITSSKDGSGIPSAGLIVSTGELKFRASTSPNGRFTIDRLPPGTYTITLEHFEHDTATEFITVAPGETPAPLNVALRYNPTPPVFSTGTLDVSVVNNDATAEPFEINGAKISIKRNRSSDPVRVFQDPSTNAGTFTKLPIGTYTINVSAQGFNDAQPRTVTVGTGVTTAPPVALQALGEAAGTLLNVLEPSVLISDYTLNLVRLSTDGMTDIETFRTVVGTADPYQWSTRDDEKLPNGLYRIDVTSLPAGYFARNVQVLDPTSVLVAGRPMLFEIRPLEEGAQQLIVPPIRIDRYPSISGQVFAPQLTAGSPDFALVDDANLEVEATCNGVPVDVEVANFDGDPLGLDVFTISRAEIGDALDGKIAESCTVTASADDRIDGSGVVAVAVSKGVNSDQNVAVALPLDPAPLGGTVFWNDQLGDTDSATVDRVLVPAAIETVGEVITRFDATVAAVGQPLPRPTWDDGPITSSTTDGNWSVAGHIFGNAEYRFTSDDFGAALVGVTLDENGRTVPTTEDQANVTADGTNDYGVELTDPDLGLAEGQVTIRTNNPSPNYAGVDIEGTDPVGVEHSPTRYPDVGFADDGSFEFRDAIPGSWSVEFTAPTNHRLDGATPVDGVVGPGADAPIERFDATVTELATVTVDIRDKNTSEVIDPAATIVVTDSASATVAADQTRDATTKQYTLTELPVAATNPETTDVTYYLDIDLDDYDMTRAIVTGGTYVDGKIAVTVRAGDVVPVTVDVAQFYSLVGTLTGNVLGGTEVLKIDSGPLATRATVEIEPVDSSGAPRATTDGLPVAVDGPGDTFRVKGAPGFYKLTVSHPNYQPVGAPYPTDPNGNIPPLAPLVFEILSTGDTTIVGDFELDLLDSNLTVEAFQTLSSSIPVTDAVVDLYPLEDTCDGTVSTGHHYDIPVTALDITPGSYCLAVNKWDPNPPNDRIAFPAITVITIDRSTQVDGVVTQTTHEVEVALPSLQPTVIGTLVALNENPVAPSTLSGTPVLLTLDLTETLDPAPVVTRNARDEANITVDGTDVSGEFDDIGLTADVERTSGDPLSWTYTFTDMPSGTNEINAPNFPGYTLDGDPVVDVTVPYEFGPTTLDPIVYRMASSDVEFDLGTDAFPSLDRVSFPNDDDDGLGLVLTSPAGATYDKLNEGYTIEKRSGRTILVMKDVAPETGDFTLSFDDILHAQTSAAVAIPLTLIDQPDPAPNPPRRDGGSVATTGDRTRLTGTAQQRDGVADNTLGPMTAGAVLTLDGAVDYTFVAPSATPEAPNADFGLVSGRNYHIDAVSGSYTLNLSNTGYTTSQVLGIDLTTTMGTVRTPGQNIEIGKLATVTIVPGLPAGVSSTVLAGFKASLVPAVGSAKPALGPNSSGHFVATVPAGTYTVVVEPQVANGYPAQEVTGVQVGAGVTAPIPVPLPRLVTLTVTGAGSGGATISRPSPLGNVAASNGVPLTFEIPAGAFTTTITSTGRMPRTEAFPATDLFSSRSVALYSPVTVTGAITATPSPMPAATIANQVVWAESTGVPTVYGTLVGTPTGGQYTINGLTNNANGSNRTWTVKYDKPGVGSGGTPLGALTVSGGSATAAGATDFTLSYDVIDFKFTVTDNAATPVRIGDATVEIRDRATPIPNIIDVDATAATGPMVDRGTVTLNVSENSKPGWWHVTKTGYVPRWMPIADITSRADPVVNVQLVPGSLPAITGGVTDGGTAVSAASVIVCNLGAAYPCTGAGETVIDTATMPAAAFTFTGLDLPPGQYTVWASMAAKTGSSTLTISATGAPTPSPLAIAISDP